jgi:hypothetical protein
MIIAHVDLLRGCPPRRSDPRHRRVEDGEQHLGEYVVLDADDLLAQPRNEQVCSDRNSP